MTATPHANDRPGPALRTEALESLLIERNLIDPKVIDGLISRYVNDVGPMNGAKVVAKAWTDPEYKARLMEDGTKAIGEFGFAGPQGEFIRVVENSAEVHNVVVCTLCSCYPWPVLGLTCVVQGPRLPCPDRARTAHRSGRNGPHVVGEHGSEGLGQQLRGALLRATRASSQYVCHVRGRTGLDCHP